MKAFAWKTEHLLRGKIRPSLFLRSDEHSVEAHSRCGKHLGYLRCSNPNERINETLFINFEGSKLDAVEGSIFNADWHSINSTNEEWQQALWIDIYHSNYPQGVQSKTYKLETIERGKNFILAKSLDHEPTRIMHIFDLDWKWIHNHPPPLSKRQIVENWWIENFLNRSC